MGLARLGTVIKYIPSPVIVGFTAGIAVIIWTGQWKDFFGLHPAASGLHFHEKFIAVLRGLPALHVATTLIASLTLAILIAGNRWLARVPYLGRVPAPLIAMLAAMAVQGLGHFTGVATIGSAFGGIPRALPGFAWPALTLSDLLQLVGPAFAIALLGAIESLLTAVVADGMTGARHDSNQELIGQGAANIIAPLLGGFAATGAVARTATSVRNGATSPLAGIVHVVFLLLVILLLAPWAAHVPLAALAAILFYVAWNMADIPHVRRLLRTAPVTDRFLLVITFVLTVFVDLVVAVNVGVVLAALLFMRRMAETVRVEQQTFDDDSGEDIKLPPSVLVYRVEGPFFFGAAEKLENALETSAAGCGDGGHPPRPRSLHGRHRHQHAGGDRAALSAPPRARHPLWHPPGVARRAGRDGHPRAGGRRQRLRQHENRCRTRHKNPNVGLVRLAPFDGSALNLRAMTGHSNLQTQAETSARKQRRILVADDNCDAAETLAMLLRLDGHEVHVANDGLQAIDMFGRTQPEVVILDIGMPGLSGHDVARRIRNLGSEPPVTLIAITGWGQKADKDRAMASGFDHHFTKPVEPTVLSALLLDQ